MQSSVTEKKLLHYVGKAIADYNLIQKGDRVLVCLSGGKDSFTLLKILQQLTWRSGHKFSIFALTLNQSQPGWDDSGLRKWLQENSIEHEIITRNVYPVVKEKVKPGKTLCGLCARLRRGNIYGYALKNGFRKIALGHHRDDLIESLLMGILYNGEIRSMPPKYITQDKKHIVLRPLIYCQEKDIVKYANEQQFPIIPCGDCALQENMMRNKMKKLIADLAAGNPKVPSNMLHALQRVRVTHLMDKKMQDFIQLEKELDW